MPKNTTKDSSLTFTLGSSRSKQTEYYDFLTDFVAFFTISLDDLNKKTRSTESDKSVKWFANQVLSAYALRGRLYDITFRSDSRAHNDFSETLSRCFALADDLIILEILQNKNDAQLTCLKTSLNELHNLGRRLETVTKWFKQNSTLQQATDELTQRFLIYLQRTVESLHDSIRIMWTCLSSSKRYTKSAGIWFSCRTSQASSFGKKFIMSNILARSKAKTWRKQLPIFVTGFTDYAAQFTRRPELLVIQWTQESISILLHTQSLSSFVNSSAPTAPTLRPNATRRHWLSKKLPR